MNMLSSIGKRNECGVFCDLKEGAWIWIFKGKRLILVNELSPTWILGSVKIRCR